MAKKRLDVLLVERGLSDSRQRAQAVIMAGEVFSGSRRLDKPGMALEEDTPLEVRGKLRYVSRGGLKLEKAIYVTVFVVLSNRPMLFFSTLINAIRTGALFTMDVFSCVGGLSPV